MALKPSKHEMDFGTAWARAKFLAEPPSERQPRAITALDAAPPFSFTYGGQPSSALLGGWKMRCESKAIQEGLIAYTRTYLHPKTGLQIEAIAAIHAGSPAVEWVILFKNTGRQDSPIIENIHALDLTLTRSPRDPEFLLHRSVGGVASFDDFAPVDETLAPNATVQLTPGGGRSSSQVMPFFNIEASNQGAVIAIGWSGEWLAYFTRDSGASLNIRAGMELTHLKLRPGEQIRTPRMLVLFWQGDRMRGHNLLRRHILAHHRPQLNGRPLESPVTTGNWGATPTDIHLDNIRNIAEHKLPLEYYWIDAEWFGDGPWPTNVGNWTTNAKIHPKGMRAIGDAAHAVGMKFMLWFEPERVYRDTQVWREHPEWLLKIEGNDSALLNLGNPDARRWLTDFMSGRFASDGIDCYRQDFNIDPLPFWRAADEPDRQGIAEIRHIEGLYAYWDELLRRQPGLIIDNCASGGRRIDLETVGRSTPLWRTDGPRDTIAHQCHTYGLLFWVPFSATSVDIPNDTYDFRSGMCSSLCTNWWVHGDRSGPPIPPGFPYDWAREMLLQHRQVRPYYSGDYYPLTPYSKADDVWMAYQLHRDDLNEGMVVAFRRPNAPDTALTFKLRDLEPDTRYILLFVDSGERKEVTGSELTEKGLTVELPNPRSSALITYRPG